MIPRDLQPHVEALATRHPVVVITGPRQSGKTTLCRSAFGDRPYASLEAPDVREFATTDPRGFLAQFPEGAVLDEVQRAPDLTSYLQGLVDADPRPGGWVLTGSQHFGLLASISQSLAGRAAIVHLLPPSLAELRRFGPVPDALDEVLVAGAYPAIHDRRLPPAEWLSAYVATYVERDVRQVLGVGDLLAFQGFVRHCAGRSAQLLNLSALGADSGISHVSARSWLSVLETSFLAMRLPPWHANVRKRLGKTPKLHLLDSGLLCWLLGIREPGQLASHPLRGAILESWVHAELVKMRVHRGLPADLHHYRDARGAEIDLVLARPGRTLAVEVKSGRTVTSDAFGSLRDAGPRLALPAADTIDAVLLHGGQGEQVREGIRVLPWSRVDTLDVD